MAFSIMIAAGLSLVLTFFEIFVLQIFEIFKVNLEMRVKLRSDSRMSDLFKVTVLSAILTTISVLIGLHAFESEGCVSDHFNENSICKSCKELVNPLCL